MCKDNCIKCAPCQKKMVMATLMKELKYNPESFELATGTSMSGLSMNEKLKVIHNAVQSPKGKKAIATVLASKTGVLPKGQRAYTRSMGEMFGNMEEPIAQVKNSSAERIGQAKFGSNGLQLDPNVSAYMNASMNELENSDLPQQSASQQDVGGILEGSASVIDSIGGVLGIFFGQSTPPTEVDIVETYNPAPRQQASPMPWIIGGLLVATAIGVTFYLTRKK